MDTRFLESFVVVIDSGSIAEAARRLNLTPGAVAQRIHALELEIGAPLISRSGRTVKPTQGGAAILDRAREFLTEVRDLQVMAANDAPSGELRLGAIHSTTSGILPDVLKQLGQTYPQIEVHIIRDQSSMLYQKVLDDRLDAAVITRPPFAISKSLEWRTLREEPLIVLAPTSVPIRQMRTVRKAHHILESQPFIALDHNSAWMWYPAQSCSRQVSREQPGQCRYSHPHR
jgi:DNA-binding transcriptional LysR family regulator